LAEIVRRNNIEKGSEMLSKVFFVSSIIVALCSAWTRAEAMSFESIPLSDSAEETIIFATGTIEAGDADRFRQILASHPPTMLVLAITSPGGSVAAALELADAVARREFSIFAVGECASACAQIVFPAGLYSMLAPGALLGIHSCSSIGLRDDLCNEEIALIAARRGFPYGSIDMFAQLYGPGDMKWMSEIGARCFGLYRSPDYQIDSIGSMPCVDGIIFTMHIEVADRSFGPSFNCQRAITSVEKLLCDDKELMLVDSILGRVYDAVRSSAAEAERDRILKEQRSFIKDRNKECAPLIPSIQDFQATRNAALCLYEYNASRIEALLAELH
jgi:uncharacterized protein YecT (DUF1311 family)